ncbi:hypothetical protein J3E69DRAFT_344339 [Trichoderma sp. SZMC 28015]
MEIGVGRGTSGISARNLEASITFPSRFGSGNAGCWEGGQQCKGRLFFSLCLHHVLSLVTIMTISANHLRITVPIRPSNEHHFHFPRRIDADISSPLQIRPTWSPHVPLVCTKTVRLRYDRAISKLPSAQANAFPRYHQQPNSVTPNAILPVLVPDIKEERSRIRNKTDNTAASQNTSNLTLRLPPKTQNLRPSETPVLPRFLPRMIRTLGSLPSPEGSPKNAKPSRA